MPPITRLVPLLLAACAPVPPLPGPVSLVPELRGDAPPDQGCIARVSRADGEFWFATLCPRDLTPDMIATLQRALAARGLYRGPANGRLTADTRAAIHAYQAARGLPDARLSHRAAQQMGLVPYAG